MVLVSLSCWCMLHASLLTCMACLASHIVNCHQQLFPASLLQVFLVDIRADKKKIKKAVQGMYDIQTKKINTLIR